METLSSNSANRNAFCIHLHFQLQREVLPTLAEKDSHSVLLGIHNIRVMSQICCHTRCYSSASLLLKYLVFKSTKKIQLVDKNRSLNLFHFDNGFQVLTLTFQMLDESCSQIRKTTFDARFKILEIWHFSNFEFKKFRNLGLWNFRTLEFKKCRILEISN